MNIMRGAFRLSAVAFVLASFYFGWTAYIKTAEERMQSWDLWRTLRCGEKFLGRDMSAYTNQFGLIDIGKAGCAQKEFLARFDEIRDALKQPNPPEFDTQVFQHRAVEGLISALAIALLVNVLGVLVVVARATGRWVWAGFRR